MSELKAGVLVTPHDEGMCFHRGEDVVSVTERETEFYLKSEADKVIAELEVKNERLEKFADLLIKDCKWLHTNYTPEKNGFETIVLCTNGKKRVAEFRKFDLRWYDVNNGNKLNVVKWLWQPRMPSDEKKYNDEVRGRLQTANLIKDEQLAAVRHHKYKRCLAMASYWVAVSYQCVDNKHRQSAKRHHRKWLELAKKFKEAK